MSPTETGDGATRDIERIERLHWGLLALAVLLSWLVPMFSPLSVAAGGVFMGMNVNLMKRLLRRVLRPGGATRIAPAMALLALKMCLFLGLLLLLFRRIPIDGLSFAGGATVFLVAAVIEGTRPGVTSQGEI